MRKIFAFLIITLCHLALAGDFEDGQTAYKNKDYKTALKKLQAAASQGDTGAQFLLGDMYFYGEGVVQNFKEAERWYRAAGTKEVQEQKKIEAEAGKFAVQEKEKLKAEEARLAAEEQKRAKAEALQKLKEQKEIAAAQSEQARKQKQEAEIARQPEAVAARADQERKKKEEAETALKLKPEREAIELAEAARKQIEPDEAVSARKLKEEKEAAIALSEQEKKQAEAEAARKEAERQRKELEDKIKKMAKESEIKEQTEDLKKRISQKADTDSTAPETSSKLVAKPSDRYIVSIQAAIRPNITFDADTVSGNPAVDIQVGLAPDGAIVSIVILKRSGIEAWDTAATRALQKTDRLPKDENGRVPPTLVISMRPKER